MKRLSTFVCALALLLVGANSASAKETTVFSLDYSTVSSVPFWAATPDGSSVTLDGGLLVINNTKDQANFWDLQLDIAEGFPATAGLDYKVTIEYKSTIGGGIWLGMGTLTGDIQYADRVVNYGASLSKSTDAFKTLEWSFNYPNTNAINHVVLQCGGFLGTISIKKVEVIEIIPDGAEVAVNYGDLKAVTPTMYVKNYGGEAVAATPDASGVYTITDEVADTQPWAAQFWIVAPEALPVGQKFKVEFDYMATSAQNVGTQTHGATPGSYIQWHCIGNVDFTGEWKHFEKEQTIESDMDGWQSIAFNMHCGTNVKDDIYTGSNTTYSIKNIVLKTPENLGEAVAFSVGTVGWASFSCAKAVDLGAVKGYAAKAHGTYVELIPVTQVPANNAVLIEGAGKHTFDVVTSAAAIAENDLQISDGNVAGDGSTIFALGKKGDEVGFMKVKSGTKIPAGKAYIEIAGGSAREFIGFGENETTGIEAIQQNAKADNQYFNLAGQRVAQPTKGLYIVNGKKVIIK